MIEFASLGIRIYGFIVQGDDTTYDITFFHNGDKVLVYNMYVERRDVYEPYPARLPDTTLAESFSDFLIDISVMEVEELITEFGEYSEWYFNNQELLESLEEGTKVLITSNEGWDSYGRERTL